MENTVFINFKNEHYKIIAQNNTEIVAQKLSDNTFILLKVQSIDQIKTELIRKKINDLFWKIHDLRSKTYDGNVREAYGFCIDEINNIVEEL